MSQDEGEVEEGEPGGQEEEEGKGDGDGEGKDEGEDEGEEVEDVFKSCSAAARADVAERQ